MLPLITPPRSLCLLRLSAIGDTTHVLPIVRSLQHCWPETQITWIIGKTEYQLMRGLTGVEFIVFDKSKGWQAYLELKHNLAQRQFDILLNFQVSLRACLASLCVRSPIRVGYDALRSKNLQRYFCNHFIEPAQEAHVLDGFFQFIEAMGVSERMLFWDIPLTKADKQWAQDCVGSRPFLVINPASSQRIRNWRALQSSVYATVISHVIKKYNMKVILTGGSSDHERELAQAIFDDPTLQALSSTNRQVLNLVGKSSLKQLAALMEHAAVVIAPDTGPAHIANAMGAPVIGLFYSSNPYRTGPYHSLKYCVNVYPEAVKRYLHQNVETLPWGTRVRNPEAAQLITADSIIDKLDEILHEKSP